jgi:hypothetical protein
MLQTAAEGYSESKKPLTRLQCFLVDHDPGAGMNVHSESTSTIPSSCLHAQFRLLSCCQQHSAQPALRRRSFHITSMPNPLATSPTEGCKSDVTICFDYLKVCGNGTYSIPYAGCHDACSTDKVHPAPSCTKTGISVPTTTKKKTKKPSVTRLACNNAKSFMCRPLNWRL